MGQTIRDRQLKVLEACNQANAARLRPWRVVRLKPDAFEIQQTGTGDYIGLARYEDRAHLIAAAPELLEALRAALPRLKCERPGTCLVQGTCYSCRTRKGAEQAIAKAEGKG